MTNLTKEHFLKVLQEASDQVFAGKGEERHGHGKDLEHQPWKVITDNVGTGFLTGQALKKAMELRTFSDNHPAWKREALGIIVYITLAIMYKDHLNEEKPK